MIWRTIGHTMSSKQLLPIPRDTMSGERFHSSLAQLERSGLDISLQRGPTICTLRTGIKAGHR